jgi:hypothetical protein
MSEKAEMNFPLKETGNSGISAMANRKANKKTKLANADEIRGLRKLYFLVFILKKASIFLTNQFLIQFRILLAMLPVLFCILLKNNGLSNYVNT